MAQQFDEIEIVIEADGTVTSEVASTISKVNHDAADAFMRNLAALMGGERKTTPIPHAHGHAHVHDGLAAHTHAKARN
jgi:hypothetical protein